MRVIKYIIIVMLFVSSCHIGEKPPGMPPGIETYGAFTEEDSLLYAKLKGREIVYEFANDSFAQTLAIKMNVWDTIDFTFKVLDKIANRTSEISGTARSSPLSVEGGNGAPTKMFTYTNGFSYYLYFDYVDFDFALTTIADVSDSALHALPLKSIDILKRRKN